MQTYDCLYFYACREYGVHLLYAYVMFGLVSTLVVITNTKEELPLKIELL